MSVTLTFGPDVAEQPDVVMHRVLTSIIHANLGPLESISAYVIDLADGE